MDAAESIAGRKAQLRAELVAARRARPIEQRDAARAALRSRLLARTDDLACVAGYLPLRDEPGSIELLAGMQARGTRVLVPITLADRDLDWAPWTPAGTGEPLGVAAIAQAQLVLAPALAVAADGTRLGRGGGSYDRALARCPDGTRVVALLFDGELVDVLPADPWDRPVDAAVTPSAFVTFTRNTTAGLDR